MIGRDGVADEPRLERAQTELVDGPAMASLVVVNHDNGQREAARQIIEFINSLTLTAAAFRL